MILNANMPTHGSGKHWAFKIAIVNEFGRTSFAEFIFALRERMDRSCAASEKFTVHGTDLKNHKFKFNVDSFNVEHDNACVRLNIHYKWDESSDKPSNWHQETFVMWETSYREYIHDADLVYKKNKPDNDPDFEQWKEGHPSTYEILFSLLLRWGDICKDLHGYDKVAHMWQHHTNSTKRWSPVSLHIAKHVSSQYHVQNIYLNSMARSFAIEVEFDFINAYGEIQRGHYISEIIKEDIVFDIESKVMKYLTGKSAVEAKETGCDEDKPIYKKPGVTYQHVTIANHGSTETQNAIERILKNSFYGTQAIGYNGKPYIDIDNPWLHVNSDLSNKEKENKEMKNRIIINHNAIIVYIGNTKAVVSVIDKKTKEETGHWNTKAGVIMAIAKVFGDNTHMYKMYEVLNTINKPTNKTLDFVADEIRLGGTRIKNYKWYHKAINTKRPEPGKQIEIIMDLATI